MYDERVCEVEKVPLVFSCCVGMGPAAIVVYNWLTTLVKLISEKRSHPPTVRHYFDQV